MNHPSAELRMRFGSILIFVSTLFWAGLAAAQTSVPLRLEGTLEPPAIHGLSKMKAALSSRGISLVQATGPRSGRCLYVGVASPGSQLALLVQSRRLNLPDAKEALCVKRFSDSGVDYLAIIGTDAMGLMYALLEAEEEVLALPPGSDWFTSIREVSEKPANSMRRMRIMLHHEANEEDWYLNPAYWDWYLDLLARNRFNALNLVFSHQTSYMAPMYPWHLKVPGFPEVKVKNLSEERRERNLEALRTISRKCSELGLELTLGVWQQLPWIEEFVGTRENQPIYVEGLNADNAQRYVYQAMKELLRQVPGVSRVQLRCNDESGVPFRLQTAFFRDSAMRAIAEANPPVRIELRIARESTIQAALDMNLGLRLSAKYYGEFMGEPYTPLEAVTRGYSYDERLRRPFKTPVFNEVWVLGSHRVFLWGSEDYGRRFGRLASYGGTIGFETDGPLAQKGYRDPYSPAWRIFKNKDMEYFRWEMERYWAFFRSVGRFGYNPDADHDVWMRPFRARFGAQAELLRDSYEHASRVIGLVVSSHINNINMYIWPEKSMGGILGVYLDQRGSDKGLFPSINEHVAEELAGIRTGRPGPLGLAREYDEIGREVDRVFARTELAPLETNKEFLATRADFLMLADLARYHAARQREGYRMARFYGTGDAGEAATALREAELAVRAWHSLADRADRWYYDKMMFAPVENGHWKDNLFLVEKEPLFVQEGLNTLRSYGLFDYAFDLGRPASRSNATVFSYWKYANGYRVAPRFTGLSPYSLYDPATGYGWTQNEGLESSTAQDSPSSQLAGTNPSPQIPLPLEALYTDFVTSKKPFELRLDLPMELHRFTFIFADKSDQPSDHGPLDVLAGGRSSSSMIKEGLRVRAGDVVHFQTDRNVRGSWYPFERFVIQPSQEGAEAILSGLIVSAQKPRLGHAPITRLDPNRDATLSVTITMPPEPGPDGALTASSSGRLAAAIFFYRTDPSGTWTQRELRSTDGFEYTATLPADQLSGRWLEYAFQATDKDGRSTRLPDARSGHEASYFARLTSDTKAPAIEHVPLSSIAPGKPITLRAKAIDPDGVAAVRAYYRPLADLQPYECIVMMKRGDEYSGTIPGEAVLPDYEFVYFLEAVDEAGNGRIYPDWRTETPYIIVPVKR